MRADEILNELILTNDELKKELEEVHDSITPEEAAKLLDEIIGSIDVDKGKVSFHDKLLWICREAYFLGYVKATYCFNEAVKLVVNKEKKDDE